jgi:hypothetical protein
MSAARGSMLSDINCISSSNISVVESVVKKLESRID